MDQLLSENSRFFPHLSLTAQLSLRVRSCITTPGTFSSVSLSSLQRRGERPVWRGTSPVKWLYRRKTYAGIGLCLKAEWRAAEAIKIEALSLAARALLIQAGAQAAVIHTLSLLHTHTFSPVEAGLTRCRHVHVHLHSLVFLSISACLFCNPPDYQSLLGLKS